MTDIWNDDAKLIEKLDQSQPFKTSDNLLSLETEPAPRAVAALQDEVIRLRKEGQKFPKKGASTEPDISDSLNGKVEDYHPLIASLMPGTTLSKRESIEPSQLAAAPNLLAGGETISSDDDLLASFKVSNRPISLAQQENLVATGLTQPEVKITPPFTLKSPVEPVLNHVRYESISHKQPQYADTDKIAYTLPATEEPGHFKIASNGLGLALPGSDNATYIAEQAPTKNVEKPPIPEIAKATPAAQRTYSASYLASETIPSNTSTDTTKQHLALSPNGATDAGKSSGEQPFVVAQNAPIPVNQQFTQKIDSSTPEKSLALNAPSNQPNISERNFTCNTPDAQIASQLDKSIPATIESQRGPKEQVAFNQPAASQSATPSSDMAKPSLIAQESKIAQESNSASSRQFNLGQPAQIPDRSGVIASASVSDYSSPVRESSRDLAKDSRDKETPIANAVNYPKFGGAAPLEESAKPVIQQQKQQSSQSSLARESAPEKGYPLSESFVSGKLLSQPTKEFQADGKQPEKSSDKSIDPKSKSVDAKSTELKSPEGKAADTKFADAKLPEGRIADPRSLDSSHLATSPTAKLGTDAQLLPHSPNQSAQGLPTDRVVLGAANPSQAGRQPTDIQPSSKSGDADINNPDKSGKKPDTTDDKKETQTTGKSPGNAGEPGKVPGSKGFNDLLDFIDKADQADIKPGGKGNIPLGGSNILSPDDVLITGTAAIGQAGFPGATDNDGKDQTVDEDQLSHRRKKYIVQADDTLESIAKVELGDERFSALILTINQSNIPSQEENGKPIAIRLQPGQILWLPSDHELQVHADLYLFD